MWLMGPYILRRLSLSLMTLLLVSIVVFSSVRLMPGDIVRTLLQDVGYDPAREAELRHELGLDRPAYEQYFVWLGEIAQGDLGVSLWDGRDVTEMIRARLPVTLELALSSIIVAILIGLPLGVLSAVKQDTPLDYVARSLGVLAISVPNFWIATLVVSLPARWWGWAPPLHYVSFTDDPVANIKVFITPALVLGVNLSGSIMRMGRSSMLEVLRLDYMRTARAKGLDERVVLYRHALRNALIPVMTIIGLQVAFLLGGSVIIESVFSLPGMGRLMIDTLTVRDYDVVQGVTLVFATIMVTVNLVVDLLYMVVDPRTKLT